MDQIFDIRDNVLVACDRSATSAVIPSDVRIIADKAFENCDKLTEVVLPEGLISIGVAAFAFCDRLEKIVLPEGVTDISYFAFINCSSLKSVVLPNSLTNIPILAFRGCVSLEHLYIPAGLTSIAPGAFRGCRALRRIEVDPANPALRVVNGCLLNGTVPVFIPRDTDIPEEATEIKSVAFAARDEVTRLIVPAGVTEIPEALNEELPSLVVLEVDPKNPVFRSEGNCVLKDTADGTILLAGCAGSVIPDGVTEIEDRAFYACEGLKEIRIPESVRRIGHEAFWGTSLLEIEVPNEAADVAEDVFGPVDTPADGDM